MVIIMKATGIVRRIDDLGRVVIPKEIRRTMRIREGDPLEIYTDREGEVIFKKYSPIGELAAFAAQYAETLHKTCSLSVVICDRDAVIACAGLPKKEYNEQTLSPQLEEIITRRSFYSHREGEATVPVLSREVGEHARYVRCAMPMISEGDVIGCVASIATDGNPRDIAEDVESKLIQTAALFLGRQLES